MYVDFLAYMLDEIYCATQRTHEFLRACASPDMYVHIKVNIKVVRHLARTFALVFIAN